MTTEKIIAIIATQLGTDPSNITADKSLINDLGADSLDIVEIVLAVEGTFGIKIEDAEYQDADTVDKVILLVESKIKIKG